MSVAAPDSSDTLSRTSGALEASAASSERVFSLAMVISGIRCVLAYVVFPWVLPVVGVAGGVGSGVGLSIGIVAIVFNVVSIRRFQRVGHRYRWAVTVLNIGVIMLLTVMVVADVSDLLT